MSKLASEILDLQPPGDDAAERWVIGASILRPAGMDELGFLSPSDFRDPVLAEVFATLLEMREKRQPIDVGLVGRHFKSEDWAARIAEIVHATPLASNARHYGRIVAKYAKFRRLRAISEELLQDAQAADGEPDAVLERAETALAAVRLSDGDGELVKVADAAADALCRIDAIRERGQSAGVPTGLLSFDNDQGGLFHGELTILAARPGNGKTSLALQIAEHNAERGRLVYFASLEMSASELSTRMACGSSGVSNRLVRIGQLTDKQAAALSEAFARQGSLALDIHDRPALTVAAIRREIRKRKKRGIALAVVDYLQLITPDDRKLPREQQVARIVRSLKETAREYDIPVLCLCQLNRQADEDEIPRLSQLRESGAIEQDADVVLFLSKHEPTNDEPHNAVLTIAKNRNGETGPIRLHWDGPRTKFSCPEGQFSEFDDPQEDN